MSVLRLKVIRTADSQKVEDLMAILAESEIQVLGISSFELRGPML
jgi:hypothetical protein